MKNIAKITLIAAVMLLGITDISYSSLPVMQTAPRWEISYQQAVDHLNPKNKYELEWERLNQELTDSVARNDAPEQIFTLAEQAYDYALKHLGGSHPFASISYRRLIYDSMKYGNERYLSLYMYGLEGSRLLLREDHNQYFEEWEKLYEKGRKPFSNERRQQVIEAAEYAYDYAKKYLGEEHPATLISIDQLFVFRNNYGRYKEAESLCNQAIKIRKKLLGPNHPETLSSIQRLIELYANMMGRKNQAELLGNQLLRLRKKVLGEEHTDILLSLQMMASLYSSQGREREVEPLLKELLYKYKRTYGINNLNTIRIIERLARLYLSQERRSDAEPLLQEWAEAVRGTVWEPELADVYQLQKKYSEAESLLKGMLKLSDKFMYPTVDVGRINLKTRLYNLYTDQKKYYEAEQLQKEIIEIKKRSLGKKDTSTIDSIRALAVLNQLQGKYKNAESAFKEAIKLSEEVFEKNHPSAIRIFKGYIFLLFSTDRFKTAFPLMQDWESRLLSRSFQELYTSSSHKVRQLYEQTVNFFLNTVSSIAIQRQHEEKYQEYAADVILRWKQLYAEEESFQHQQLANSNAPEIVKLRNNLKHELN